MSIVRMTDLDLAGKRVLIRQDLNVPVADGRVTYTLGGFYFDQKGTLLLQRLAE